MTQTSSTATVTPELKSQFLVAMNRIADSLEAIAKGVKIAGLGPDNLAVIARLAEELLKDSGTLSDTESVVSFSDAISSQSPAPHTNNTSQISPLSSQLPATDEALATPSPTLSTPLPATGLIETGEQSARKAPTPEYVKASLSQIDSDSYSTWYCVTVGRKPGVYFDASEASYNVLGVSCAVNLSYKSKDSALEAYANAFNAVPTRVIPK